MPGASLPHELVALTVLLSDRVLDRTLDELTVRAGHQRNTDALGLARWDLKAALQQALEADPFPPPRVRAELPDDVKRNSYTADREAGLHVKGLRSAGETDQRTWTLYDCGDLALVPHDHAKEGCRSELWFSKAILDRALRERDEAREALVTDEKIARGEMALCQFVFPGSLVPRREMAEAVLRAVSHNDDPRVGIAKRTVRAAGSEEENDRG